MKNKIVSLLLTLSLIVLLFNFTPPYNLTGDAEEYIPVSQELIPVYEGSFKELNLNFDKNEDLKIHTNIGSFDPVNESEPSIPENLRASFGEAGQFIIQYGQTHPRQAKDLIEKLNGDIYGHFSSYSFRVKLNTNRLEALKIDSRIRAVLPVHPTYKIDPSLKDSNGNVLNEVDGDTTKKLAVLLWDSTVKDQFIEYSKSLGAKNILPGGVSTTLVEMEISLNVIDELAKNNDVVYVQFAGEAVPELDDVHNITNVNPVWNNFYRGERQTVALVDTGLDTAHPGFTNKVVSVIDYGNSGASTDPDGHGTHVGGIMIGTGAQSVDNNKRGMAYNGNVLVQAYLGCTSCPSLTDLMADTWNNGVRISNNSWGKSSVTTNRYDSYAREVDSFIHNIVNTDYDSSSGKDKNTFIFVKSAGNDLKITSPGSAKNVITVGASYNTKTDDPNKIWTTSSSGSGRGPTDDGRTKPDIVAPGYKTVSTLSSNSGLNSYYGNDFYTLLGGTSMAAPVVSGASALVRQYYREKVGIIPSASLVKAHLINGAAKLTAYTFPGNDQGWGRLNIGESLFPSSGNWAYSDARHVNHKTDVTYNIDVNNSTIPFITTLTWIDPPGDPANADTDVTVSDLDLIIQSPSGKTYASQKGKETVEQVRIASPEIGTWKVIVRGYDVPSDYQNFSLVIWRGL
jgi:subtilisin family serine protease